MADKHYREMDFRDFLSVFCWRYRNNLDVTNKTREELVQEFFDDRNEVGLHAADFWNIGKDLERVGKILMGEYSMDIFKTDKNVIDTSDIKR